MIAAIPSCLQVSFVKLTISIHREAGTSNFRMLFPPAFTVIVWVACALFIL